MCVCLAYAGHGRVLCTGDAACLIRQHTGDCDLQMQSCIACILMMPSMCVPSLGSCGGRGPIGAGARATDRPTGALCVAATGEGSQ